MKKSAGIICYTKVDGINYFLLGLPGGPYYCNFDAEGKVASYKNEVHKWTILKGGLEEGESEKEAAIREFEEESGLTIKERKEDLIELGYISYKNGKRIYAWGVDAFFNTSDMASNFCDVEYKGNKSSFPEICKYKYMTLDESRKYCNKSQFELVEKLNSLIDD